MWNSSVINFKRKVFKFMRISDEHKILERDVYIRYLVVWNLSPVFYRITNESKLSVGDQHSHVQWSIFMGQVLGLSNYVMKIL